MSANQGHSLLKRLVTYVVVSWKRNSKLKCYVSVPPPPQDVSCSPKLPSCALFAKVPFRIIVERSRHGAPLECYCCRLIVS